MTYGVKGPVNQTGNAVYSTSDSFTDNSGDGGTMKGEAHYTGGFDPGSGDVPSVDHYGDGLRIDISSGFTLLGKAVETIEDRDKTTVSTDVVNYLEGVEMNPNGDDKHEEDLTLVGDVWPPGGDADQPKKSLTDASDFLSNTWVGAKPTHSKDGSWHLQYTGHKTKISPDNDPKSIKTTRTLVIDLTITPTSNTPKKKITRKKK